MSSTAPIREREPVSPPPEASSTSTFRREARLTSQIIIAGELLFSALGILLAFRVRSVLPNIHGAVTHATIVACVVVSLVVVIAAQVERRRVPASLQPFSVLRYVVLSSLLVFAALFLFRSQGNAVSRPTLFLFSGFLALLLPLWNFLAREKLKRLAHYSPLHIVLLGSSERTNRLSMHLAHSGRWKLIASFGENMYRPGMAVDILDQLQTTLRTQAVDAVLLSPWVFEAEGEATALYHGVAELCKQTCTNLCIDAEWLDGYSGIYLDHLGPRPVLTFSFTSASPWPLIIKRAIDVVFGSILLISSLPILAVAAIAIRITSAGPIFFSQTRCGLRGRPFRIYKLRSMTSNAEELKAALKAHNTMTGPAFKLERDPRITSVGYWLRKTSIDELPQLYNVIRGEMSLVGPRPPLPEEVQQYPTEYFRRLAMKPGITGLWQVSGRSEILNFQAWVELDTDYIQNWSLMEDFRILFRTIRTVLRMTGK